jgi:DNA segregation ATPase FtsK/SpoIIIE-like protein
MYDQAVEVVLKTRRPSISLVQRHLRIGYNRAARLIEADGKGGAGDADEWRRRTRGDRCRANRTERTPCGAAIIPA